MLHDFSRILMQLATLRRHIKQLVSFPSANFPRP